MWIWSVRSGTIPPCYIHVWSVCTDAGPDQLAFRGAVKTEMTQETYSHQMFWDVSCVKHQLHLLVKDGMKFANGFMSESASTKKKVPYFSAVAQIVHCWRAHSTKLNKLFNVLVPQAWQHRASVSIPPVAISGRWCSIDSFLAKCLLLCCWMNSSTVGRIISEGQISHKLKCRIVVAAVAITPICE